MSMFVQLLVVGVAMGMIYAFMAMGIILLVRAIGVLNFAQGELFMAGAFISYMFTYMMELPFWIMLIASIITFIIGGIVFMFCVYWPLRNTAWPTAIIISTLGASMVIKELVKTIFGSYPLAPAKLVEGSMIIGNVRLEWQYFIIIIVGIISIALVFILFDKLYAGRAMQAAAQDKYSAELIGISIVKTTTATYVISTVLSGLGGFLASSVFSATMTLGSFLLRAFAGIIIGGYGNIKGALVGCLFVGVIESFAVLLTSNYKDAVVFLILLIVLSIRPQGIFGQLIGEKV